MGLRTYKDELTVDINQKGVLDLDTIKGCALGCRNCEKGCWGLCYAYKIANYRGIDFSKSITRWLKTKSQMKSIGKTIFRSEKEFVRIGTMGDPCHNWDYTLRICKWVANSDKPIVIITKHWIELTDKQMEEFGKLGVIINTSLSALDTKEQIEYRLKQYERYKKYGKSVLRIISCDFNRENKEGKRLAEIQDELFKNDYIIDNPLRVPLNYPMVKSGIIKVKKIMDINSKVYMSKVNPDTYIGVCKDCPEMCGVNFNYKKNEQNNR